MRDPSTPIQSRPLEQVAAKRDRIYASAWRSSIFFVGDNFIGKAVQRIGALPSWNESARFFAYDEFGRGNHIAFALPAPQAQQDDPSQEPRKETLC